MLDWFLGRRERQQNNSKTVDQIACDVIRSSKTKEDEERGFHAVLDAVKKAGWEIELLNDEADNTASFSRQEGKRIIRIHTQGKSYRHLTASLVHEYLFGNMVQEADNFPTQLEKNRAMRTMWKDTLERDKNVAYAIPDSWTKFGQTRRANSNLNTELTDGYIAELLSK